MPENEVSKIQIWNVNKQIAEIQFDKYQRFRSTKSI